MKNIFYACLIILLIIGFWLESYDPSEKSRRLSEPTEIFFNPKEGILSLSDEKPVSIELRTMKTVFEVPKNSLVRINHPYMPIARKIWDSFSYWVVWPSYEGRTADNISNFLSEKPPNIIKIYVGSFGTKSSCTS